MKKGFIKNLTSVFRRYENKFLSLNKRFIVPDEKSDAFYDLSDRFYEREGVREHLKHPIELLKMSYANEDHITNAIGFYIMKFTDKDVSDEELHDEYEEWAKNITNNEISFEYENRDHLIIKFKDGKYINVSTLTSVVENIEKDYPDISTAERDGKCHPRSLNIAIDLGEYDTYCVTGSVWQYSPRAKWLHSWVECEVDGQVYCLDNNSNSLMAKEDFYYINHAKVIERISRKTIEEDLDIINYLGARSDRDNPYIKLYCSSREEAIEKYHELVAKENEAIQQEQ